MNVFLRSSGFSFKKKKQIVTASVYFKFVMEENCVYDVAEGVVYNEVTGDGPSYDTTSFNTKPQVAPGYDPCYDVANYPSPTPKVTPGCNPCYDMAGTTAQVSSATAILKAKKPTRGCPCSWVCIGLVLVGVVACVSMAVAVWNIAEVHSISTCAKSCSDQSTGQTSAALARTIDSLRSEIITLRQDVDVFRSEVTRINLGQLSTVPATSCLEISLSDASTPSGYYWVTPVNGSAVRVYCDMTRSCGGVTRGWMRVAHLDFNDTSTTCPSGLRKHVDSGIRTCGIESSGAACPSVMFSTSGVEYTKVCGKVVAYQYKSTDAFGQHNRDSIITIDSNYVDGVSLTHGHTPRTHVWTFAAAYSQDSTINPPSFVGHDYFCDSGYQSNSNNDFYFEDPLWDGAGCGSYSTCCSFNNPPWFHKELPSPTSDDIEMRVCCDQGRSDEDIAMSTVEIYVQ